MKKVWVSIFFLSGFAIALWMLTHQHDRFPSSTPPNNRIVTSPIDIGDWPLQNDDKKAAKRLLLASWDWHFHSELLHLSFENLKIKTDSMLISICDTYTRMILKFEAPNTIYNGEHPEIIFETTCERSQDNQSLASVRPVNIELNFNFLNDSEALKKILALSEDSTSVIRIQNWDNETPKRWRLKQILFLPNGTEMGGPIDLTKYEIFSVLQQHVEFEVYENKL